MATSFAPDLILCNGRIVTVDRPFSIHEAVAVYDGKFAAVGDTDGDGVADAKAHAEVFGANNANGARRRRSIVKGVTLHCKVIIDDKTGLVKSPPGCDRGCLAFTTRQTPAA